MYPAWYSQKGYKMAITHCQPVQGKLTLSSSAARLRIRRYEFANSDPPLQWVVNWKVVISHRTEWTEGQRLFSNVQLKHAVGLIGRLPGSDPDDEHMVMAEQYEADAAWPGLYIRKGTHLNIPDPGTGHFPHSSVSILLKDEIQEAVAALIDCSGNPQAPVHLRRIDMGGIAACGASDAERWTLQRTFRSLPATEKCGDCISICEVLEGGGWVDKKPVFPGP